MKNILVYGALAAICVLGIGFLVNYQKLAKIGDLNANLLAEMAEMKNALEEIGEKQANYEREIDKKVKSVAKMEFSNLDTKIASKLS